MGGTRLEGGRGSALGTLGGVITVSATTALNTPACLAHSADRHGADPYHLIMMDHLVDVPTML